MKAKASPISGFLYEIKILMLCFLRCVNKEGFKFKLYSNWRDAENTHDDVVLYDGNKKNYRFIQAKMSTKEGEMSDDTHFKGTNKDKKFILSEHFKAYQNLKRLIPSSITGPIKDVILFTNAPLDSNNTFFEEAKDPIARRSRLVQLR